MVAPVVVAAIIAAAASLISSLIALGKDLEAQRVRSDFAKKYGALQLPHLDKEIERKLGPSALEKIRENPEVRASQLGALRALEQEYQQGGMTPADAAAMQLAANAVSARAGSDYQSAARQMASRGGVRGGGAEAALYAQSGQNAANALGQMGLGAQVAARSRALQALEAQGGLSTQIRGQDYQRDSDLARAQDRIQEANLRMAIDTKRYNDQLKADEFNRRIALLQAQSNAINGVASGLQTEGQTIRNVGSGIGQGAMSVGSAYQQSLDSESSAPKARRGSPYGRGDVYDL